MPRLDCARRRDALRVQTGLDLADTIRGEGAPIPLKPLSRWDNGRDVVFKDLMHLFGVART